MKALRPALSLALMAAGGASAQEAVKWDMDSFCRIVHPLRHEARGRLPFMLWNLPLPRDGRLVEMRRDGSLRKAIDQLAARGIVPTVEMGWEWTPEGAMAMAQTLQEAGRPVNILLPRVDLIEGTAYADCPIQVEGPDASRGGANRKWPCLALAEPEKTAEWLGEQLKPYRDAGIKVAGLWFDDECLPHPWNGCWEAQRSTEECRRAYPAGILDTFDAFRKWADPLKAELFTKGTAAIRGLFPGIRIGCYGDTFSGRDGRFGLDAQMPSAYANTVDPPQAFADKPLTQEAIDRFYFTNLLGIVSAANRALGPGKLSIPYLSRYVPDNGDPKYAFPMSQARYRELVRHVLLRGASSLYLFNLGYPGSPVSAEFSFESIEDVRVVYDELLEHREFLDKGEPMNFDGPTEAGVVWSGLRLKDRCLVRVGTLGNAPGAVTIEAFPGMKRDLAVPAEGATYLLYADGRVQAVKE